MNRINLLNAQAIGELVALVNEDRLGEAEESARRLLATHPNVGMLWKILSVALVRQGKEMVVSVALQSLPDTPRNEVQIKGQSPFLGATVANRLERWVVMQAPTGQRFCVVRVQRPGFPKNANRWD